MKIDDILSEGPNDPHIFKAVFLAGGPGSGKSFVSGKLLSGTGLRVVNSDDIYEYMMKKQGMALDPETIFSPAGQDTREKAKSITKRKQQSHIDGRLGLVIDGTGKDVAKYAKTKKMLEDLGYETMMLFVNTSLDIAQERNQQRPRSLDPKVVEKMWNGVQENIMAFQQLFGAQNFYVVDNSGGLEDPARSKNFNKVSKAVTKFINSAPRMPAAKKWLDAQKPKQESVNEDRAVTQTDLQKLEYYADKVFAKVGIDVEFTRHFLDRVNDERNDRQITLPELAVLFRDEYAKWGKKIAQLGPDAEAVMKDMRSDINIPFALVWDNQNQELDLVAKTVMRKKNFKTTNQEFPVESAEQIDEAVPVVAAAIWVIKWAIRFGAWPVIKWLLKRYGKKFAIGAAAIAAIDQGWDWVISQIGKEYAQLLIDNKFEIGMAVALILGAVTIKRMVEQQGDALTQKLVKESAPTDQLKGKEKMPAKVKPNLTKGSQKHPHQGKLVGGV